MDEKIRLVPLDTRGTEEHHFVAYFERPGRIEVMSDGRVFAHVYEGTTDDEEQEPLGGYDADINENEAWTH